MTSFFEKYYCFFSFFIQKKCSFFQKFFAVCLYAVIFAKIICFYKK